MRKETKPKSSKMVPAMIVVIIISAIGVWYLLRLNAPVQPVVMEPVYYKMDPVIVNLKNKNPRHYFKVEPVVVSRNPAWASKQESYRPVIRNYLINRLRKETVNSISEPQSFERVRTDVKEGIKALILESSGVDYIEDVMFSEFVVQ